MYVCMYGHAFTVARIWINRGIVANPARGQLNRRKCFFLPHPRLRLRILSRETGSGRPVPRHPTRSPHSGICTQQTIQYFKEKIRTRLDLLSIPQSGEKNVKTWARTFRPLSFLPIFSLEIGLSTGMGLSWGSGNFVENASGVQRGLWSKR